MALKQYKPNTPGQRGLVLVDKSDLFKGKPIKKLTVGLTKSGGRNNSGKITMWQRGGGHKRRYRIIDFKRTKVDIFGTVERIEYDPNRSAYIALIKYDDNELRYIIAPQRLGLGDKVISSIISYILTTDSLFFRELIKLFANIECLSSSESNTGSLLPDCTIIIDLLFNSF